MGKIELEDLIRYGSEERNLEYKSPMSWKNSKLKVVKACLAMSNIPDGGYIIFGVEETSSGRFEAKGMTSSDASSFNQDDIQESVNEYADPYVEVKVDPEEVDAKKFIVIQIKEFSEIPVICKKNGKGLKRGEVYTRPRRKHESVVVPSQIEMREIIDLAVDKKIRKEKGKFIRWVAPPTISEVEVDKEKFDKQRRGF